MDQNNIRSLGLKGAQSVQNRLLPGVTTWHWCWEQSGFIQGRSCAFIPVLMGGIIDHLNKVGIGMSCKAFDAMCKNAFAAKHVILFWYRVAKSATAAGSDDDNACFWVINIKPWLVVSAPQAIFLRRFCQVGKCNIGVVIDPGD